MGSPVDHSLNYCYHTESVSWHVDYYLKLSKKERKQAQLGVSHLEIQVELDHPIPQGFYSFLLKPYIKEVTQFGELERWRTLMVECVTVFCLIDPKSDFALKLDLFGCTFLGNTYPFYYCSI